MISAMLQFVCVLTLIGVLSFVIGWGEDFVLSFVWCKLLFVFCSGRFVVCSAMLGLLFV